MVSSFMLAGRFRWCLTESAQMAAQYCIVRVNAGSTGVCKAGNEVFWRVPDGAEGCCGADELLVMKASCRDLLARESPV